MIKNLFLFFLLCLPFSQALELVSDTAEEADSGYVDTGAFSWMDDLGSATDYHLAWGIAPTNDSGKTWFTSWLTSPGATGLNIWQQQGENSPEMFASNAQNYWEVVQLEGLIFAVNGGENAQSLHYKNVTDSAPSMSTVSLPDGIGEIRQLRLVRDGVWTLVFTGVTADNVKKIYQLRVINPLIPPSTPTAISPEGCFYPTTSANGVITIWQTEDGKIQMKTDGDPLDLWPSGMQPHLAADGGKLAFVDTSEEQKRIVLFDVGTTSAMTIGDFASTTGYGDSPWLSTDGSLLVFRSNADLIAGLSTTEPQVYLADTTSGAIFCVSQTAAGEFADGICTTPALSPNGRYVTFSSNATNLTDADAASNWQVYRHDLGAEFANDTPPTLTTSADNLFCNGNDASLANQVELPFSATDEDGDAVELAVFFQTAASGTLRDKDQQEVEGWISTDQLPLVFEPAEGFAGTVELSLQARANGWHSIPQAITIQVSSEAQWIAFGTPENRDVPGIPFYNDVIGVSSDNRWLVCGVEDFLQQSKYELRLWDLEEQTSTSLASLSSGFSWPRVMISSQGEAVAYLDSGTLKWLPLVDGVAGASLAAGSADSFVLSSDGQTVLFADGGELYRWCPLTGTDPEYLTDGAIPTLSTDGRQVFFRTDDAGTIAQLTFADDGSISEQGNVAVEAGQTIANLRTSMGGRFLLYEVNENVKIVDLAGTAETVVIGNAKQSELSQNGSRTYYVSTVDGMGYVRNLVSGETTALYTLGRSDYDVHRGALSQDGYTCTFVSGDDLEGGREGMYDVYRKTMSFEANTAPTAGSETLQTVEDSPDILSGALTYGDADAEDRELQVDIQQTPENGDVMTVERDLDGTIRFAYRPSTNFAGTEKLIFTVTDTSGATATGTISFEVQPVDDPPVLDTIPNQDRENSSIPFTSVDLNDYLTEVDGDTLLYTCNQDELPDWVSLNSTSGIMTFSPSASWTGRIDITVTITDQTDAGEATTQSFFLQRWWTATTTIYKGWNALSFPLTPDEDTAQNFLDLLAPNIYYWDSETQSWGYIVAASELVAGQGYMVYYRNDQLGDEVEFNMRGALVTSYSTTLRPTWSLVGATGNGTEATLPAEISAGNVYYYQNGFLRYRQLSDGEKLQAGKSYWIRSGEETTPDLELE